jgi:hypothetical protein
VIVALLICFVPCKILAMHNFQFLITCSSYTHQNFNKLLAYFSLAA